MVILLAHVHIGVGDPPVFLSQPEDVMATSLLLSTYRGIKAHIIITCNVTGSPAPDVTWFRGESQIDITIIEDRHLVLLNAPGDEGGEFYSFVGLVDDISLYLNMTAHAQVSIRETEIFHCRATNMLGESITAIARSRNISVIFTCEFLL